MSRGELVRILGIAGSLRRGSYNRAALRAATALVPDGATLETFDLEGIHAELHMRRGEWAEGALAAVEQLRRASTRTELRVPRPRTTNPGIAIY